MPIVHIKDVEEIAVTSPDGATLVMRKMVGSPTKDPRMKSIGKMEGVSLSHIESWGYHRRGRSQEADRIMYVAKGSGVAIVGDEPPAHVVEGDCIVVPKGTAYQFSGTLTYLFINAPAFRDGSDERNAAYDGPPVRAGKDRWSSNG